MHDFEVLAVFAETGGALVRKGEDCFGLAYPYIGSLEPVSLDGSRFAVKGQMRRVSGVRNFCLQRHRAMIAPNWVARMGLSTEGDGSGLCEQRRQGVGRMVAELRSEPPDEAGERFMALSALRRIEGMPDEALAGLEGAFGADELALQKQAPAGMAGSNWRDVLWLICRSLAKHREWREAEALLLLAISQKDCEDGSGEAEHLLSLALFWVRDERRLQEAVRRIAGDG